ncbi:hypothetical protein B0A50_06787 [Salinomyces thailandicus]|uniref:Uncharacterized protein n=1 Tax=Salinomyces thailandicus TaxID=706561 RepID=A0A4U0TQL3_9PEZI|nr:hypothetical protein B0A50_06787 [Salinomyces thailandica]
MSSRSNSNAGDGLRRAKSTSSHHTTSSGHQRSSTSIDPFVTRQHAEAAAVEAYNRARQCDETAPQAGRPVPPKLQRRRSQTGRTEGSHFEDARLGRRRSGTTKADPKPTQPARARPPAARAQTADSAGEERVVTRKRAVIPPNAASSQVRNDYLPIPTTGQRFRKAQSAYSDGSPTSRNISSSQRDRHSSLQRSSTPVYRTDGYGVKLATLSSFGEPVDDTVPSPASLKPSIRETQTDEEILAMARDKCLQDFQQRKVRERKSLFLVPFQKRRATAGQQGSSDGFDHGLPPFNHAGDTALPSLPTSSERIVEPPKTTLNVQKKPRTISDTLKGRFKRAFGKATKGPASVPAQQVEAKNLHYPARPSAYREASGGSNDPFSTFDSAALAPPRFMAANVGSKESLSQHSDSKSRVTSWTNSTATCTLNSRAGRNSFSVAQDSRKLPRSDSQATLRKASSFFGRPVANKLRKSSKAQLKTTDESQGLYSALQDRLRPTKRAVTPSLCVEQPSIAEANATTTLASLPSQQRRRAVSRQSEQSGGHSIRTITPEQTATKINICSPVLEVATPDADVPSFGQIDDVCPGSAPRSDLQRRWARKAPPPSQEQLTRRMEKSKNRWQSPLNELSPAASRSNRATMLEENPYELRSLSQTHAQPPVRNELPHHSRVECDEPLNRAPVLSPSVYSRATDGASPRPFTPADNIGTVVTITGREVRSYSISPPKTQQIGAPKKQEKEPSKPTQTSGQWRRWLSDEMNSFRNGLEGLTLTQALMDGDQPAANALLSPTRLSQENGSQREASRPSSASPSLGACSRSVAMSDRPPSATIKKGRRTTSRTSSGMNERYPMIGAGRNSSERSIGSRNNSRQDFPTGSRTSDSPPDHGMHPSVDSQGQRTSFGAKRVITGRQSIPHIDTAARSRSALGSYDNTQEPVMSGALVNESESLAPTKPAKPPMKAERRPKVSSKHKSAFELRANYKHSSNSRSTPLEIRRKKIHPESNMLEDSTIMDIAAGPYASHQSLDPITSQEEAKENARPASAVDDDRLPALSSSEWLAAGPKKPGRPSTVHPALRSRTVSRYSPVRTAAQGKGSPASPGQKLAGEWLEKRSRENTPAFM